MDDNKAELGEPLSSGIGGEGGVDAFGLGAGVDIKNDGVLLGGIEVEGFPHRAVDIGYAIFGFDLEGLGHSPAGAD